MKNFNSIKKKFVSWKFFLKFPKIFTIDAIVKSKILKRCFKYYRHLILVLALKDFLLPSIISLLVLRMKLFVFYPFEKLSVIVVFTKKFSVQFKNLNSWKNFLDEKTNKLLIKRHLNISGRECSDFSDTTSSSGTKNYPTKFKFMVLWETSVNYVLGCSL